MLPSGEPPAESLDEAMVRLATPCGRCHQEFGAHRDSDSRCPAQYGWARDPVFTFVPALPSEPEPPAEEWSVSSLPPRYGRVKDLLGERALVEANLARIDAELTELGVGFCLACGLRGSTGPGVYCVACDDLESGFTDDPRKAHPDA